MMNADDLYHSGREAMEAGATLELLGEFLARAFLELGTYGDALDQAEEALRRVPGDRQALELRQAARQHLEA